MAHLLAPVEPPYDPEVAAALARYPRQDGYLLELFRVFANSLRFLRKGVANLLDRDSPLPMRLREIVILRVCATHDCEYEWGVHVAAFGRHAGLTDEQIRASRLGPADAPCWSDEERALVRLVDELCADGRPSPASRLELQRRWTADQQLEILALCGNYHTVCFVANTAGLGPEPFAATFPER